MPIIHKLHGIALRLFWKIIAPGHPRGWLDLHPVLNEDNETGNVHCHGMEKWNLPNIEFRNVPLDLLGPCHGILLAITDYLKNVSEINADESIGGTFHSDDQIVYHQATLRAPSYIDENHDNYLVVVDHLEEEISGFPKKLFAAHLISIANSYSNPIKKETFLKRATEIYTDNDEETPSTLEEAYQNPNNYFAWEGLAICYADQQKSDESIEAFKEAIKRWPFGGKSFAVDMKECIKNGELPSPDEDPVSKFWHDIDIDKFINEQKNKL